MTHNRKLALLGVSLTNVRPPRSCVRVATEVRDEIEEVIIQSGFLNEAPFEWVTLALRYGLREDDEPTYLGIDKESGDLELAIEVEIDAIKSADDVKLKKIFSDATVKALRHAGERYNLNNDGLNEYSRSN